MNFNSLFKKQPAEITDPRRSQEKLIGGRRHDEVENPYLSARRTWNDHMQTVMSSRQAWQIMGILSLLVALVGVGGMIHIGQQSRFIPYVIQVDKLGETAAISIADKAVPADQRVIASADKDMAELYFSDKNPVLTRQEKQAMAIADKWKGHNSIGMAPTTGKNGAVSYLFGVQQPSVVCAVLQVCDVALQAGEQVNSINLGDTARWTLEPAITGSGDSEVQHIILA